jgi:hypothetical protein
MSIKDLFQKHPNTSATEVHDELLGLWVNQLPNIGIVKSIYTFAIEFLDNGNGFVHYKLSKTNQKTTSESINWSRTNPSIINIKLINEEDWTTVEYELIEFDFLGSFNNIYYKLNEKSKKEFWRALEPLYKFGNQ